MDNMLQFVKKLNVKNFYKSEILNGSNFPEYGCRVFWIFTPRTNVTQMTEVPKKSGKAGKKKTFFIYCLVLDYIPNRTTTSGDIPETYIF